MLQVMTNDQKIQALWECIQRDGDEVAAEAFTGLRQRAEQAEDELLRIKTLPEMDWARVTAVIIQGLALHARSDQPAAKAMLEALDQGKTYVGRLRDRAEQAEQSLSEARAEMDERVRIVGEATWDEREARDTAEARIISMDEALSREVAERVAAQNQRDAALASVARSEEAERIALDAAGTAMNAEHAAIARAEQAERERDSTRESFAKMTALYHEAEAIGEHAERERDAARTSADDWKTCAEREIAARERAEADNAALLERLGAVVEKASSYDHAEGCYYSEGEEGEDASPCTCAVGLAEMAAVAPGDHPGAALLERTRVLEDVMAAANKAHVCGKVECVQCNELGAALAAADALKGGGA